MKDASTCFWISILILSPMGSSVSGHQLSLLWLFHYLRWMDWHNEEMLVYLLGLLLCNLQKALTLVETRKFKILEKVIDMIGNKVFEHLRSEIDIAICEYYEWEVSYWHGIWFQVSYDWFQSFKNEEWSWNYWLFFVLILCKIIFTSHLFHMQNTLVGV